MTQISLKRPRSGPSQDRFGPLGYEHFQVAYSTNDIDRACSVFAERYGISEFKRLEGEMEGGGKIRIELAWAGGIMYELIQASGPAAEFYTRRLPSDGFAIRHHHLGFLVPNADAWEALEKQIEQGFWKIELRTEVPGFLNACYVSAPELEHFLEYIFPFEGGREFFEKAPSC